MTKAEKAAALAVLRDFRDSLETMPATRKLAIRDALQAGCTRAEIATALGITRQALARHIEKADSGR